MSYYFSKTIDTGFEQAVANVTEKLKAEGFGILTEIDVKSTLKKKLDVDFRNYRILGACNPPFAYEALQAEDKIGTMLPCNVIVQETADGKVEVAAIDPIASMQAVGNPELREIARKFDFKIISIKDLIEYRIKRDSLIDEIVRVDMPTQWGHFKLVAFQEKNSPNEHLALVKGTWEPGEPVLVRVHSSCFTGDILGSMRCDCGEQLHQAMQMVEEEGKGVILYMNQEGRGIGLLNKLKAYRLQEDGLDTVEANLHLGFQTDQRDYGVGAQILRHLGICKIRLISNNPKKRVGLIGYGLEIVENVPIKVDPNPHNERYLLTKRDKLGHEFH